ncbi:ArsR family transcriptional regulator [Natronococcus sp. A-GB7]|uniref:ArsR family transcriptional regulator n=1 Tax=Natronococcus sp. A-GB7 TaxID=3037649 RepID=UPI00241C895C|nr:ArsR family transcriptional regulator [Natronococcus sp. A-GB7]MDG5821667.1 ArsR family transcriptional regulator [Natronococcus sp. A-GB7]
MRLQADWMVNTDELLLEFLEETGLALPPRVMAYNIKTRYNRQISYSTINRRLKHLKESGLVEKEYESGGFYSLSDDGRSYLDGDLDASELEYDVDGD